MESKKMINGNDIISDKLIFHDGVSLDSFGNDKQLLIRIINIMSMFLEEFHEYISFELKVDEMGNKKIESSYYNNFIVKITLGEDYVFSYYIRNNNIENIMLFFGDIKLNNNNIDCFADFVMTFVNTLRMFLVKFTGG